MEDLGWIRFDPRQSGRGRSISLTPAGTRLLLEVRPAWEKAQEAARSQLGRGAFAGLRKLLQPIGRMRSGTPAPPAAAEGLESWMHARRESLLLCDAQQHPGELLLFLRAQGLAKRMLMFPRHTPDRIERSAPCVRQVQRMGAPVVEVVAPFHQPADSSSSTRATSRLGRTPRRPARPAG